MKNAEVGHRKPSYHAPFRMEKTQWGESVSISDGKDKSAPRPRPKKEENETRPSWGL